MKRIIVLALMTAMICGAAFAQIALSGYINSGAGVATNDVSGTDPAFAVRGVDSEQNGYRFRLNGQYTNEAKTAGLRFRFQMQGGSTGAKSALSGGSTNSVTVPDTIPPEGFAHTHTVTGSTDSGFSVSHVWGWMNFFDNKIQLNGGRIEESTWSTGDFWLTQDSVSRFAGDGVLLKVMPIDGLILGAGIYATGRDGIQIFQDMENARINAHLAYTMPDVFRVNVSYRTHTFIDKEIRNSAISGTSGDGPSMIFADFRYLGIKELTAVLAFQVNNLEEFSDLGTMTFSETFGYKINDELNVGLNAVQFISNVDDYDIGLLFNPWVTYKIDKIVPRLDVVYFIAGRSNFNTGNLDNAWHRRAFAATGNNDVSVFNIRPSITINVDNRTKLEIGDSIYFDKNGTDVMTNVFYIDMVWSF